MLHVLKKVVTLRRDQGWTSAERHLAWESAGAKPYTIQTSDGGTTWRPLTSVAAGDGGPDDLTVGATARFVRRQAMTRALPDDGYSLDEFGIYRT